MIIHCDLTSPDATCPRCGFVSKVRGAIRQCRKPAPRLCGVGCHLARLLSWFGIRDDGKCGCHEFSAQMDAWGPDGCEREIEKIMVRLQMAAAKRLPLVPWVDAPVRLLVHQAVANARREATHASGDGRGPT